MATNMVLVTRNFEWAPPHASGAQITMASLGH